MRESEKETWRDRMRRNVKINVGKREPSLIERTSNRLATGEGLAEGVEEKKNYGGRAAHRFVVEGKDPVTDGIKRLAALH